MHTLSPALLEKIRACEEVLQKITSEHKKVVFANSLGAEDMVLTDIICKKFPDIGLFTLDTGRLPAATYALMQQTEERYGKVLKYYYPDAQAIETYTRQNGINAFYTHIELRKACCNIRKVEPLKRALYGQDAWITGLRRAQSTTRAQLEILEYDHVFGLHKANPLADWTEKEIWAYIKACKVPYNALHDQGYPTIGCAPCSRAIAKGEDIRAGRWWWENPETKECGLHPDQKTSG